MVAAVAVAVVVVVVVVVAAAPFPPREDSCVCGGGRGEAAGARRGNRGRETSFAVARRANYVPGWVSFKVYWFIVLFPAVEPARKNYCLTAPKPARPEAV